MSAVAPPDELGNRTSRVALIPDHAVAAVDERTDLGVLEDNILLIADDATAGKTTLAADNGVVFVLTIGDRWPLRRRLIHLFNS